MKAKKKSIYWGEISFYKSIIAAIIFSAVVLVVDQKNIPSLFIDKYGIKETVIGVIFGTIILSLCIGRIHISDLLKMPCGNVGDGAFISGVISCISIGVCDVMLGLIVCYKLIALAVILIFLIVIVISRYCFCRTRQFKAQKVTNSTVDLGQLVSGEISELKLPIIFTEEASEYDLLGREGLVNVVYNSIRGCNPEHVYVIGLKGAWGSGKTTILNIVKRKIQENSNDIIVIDDFDPWIFGKLNRCVFEATTARIIWASALNPTYILEALSRDVDLLSKLPMPVRYDSYKNIELLFKDLHGNIVERYTSLKDRAVEYMQNEAERDLEGYRRSLPAEAVYQRYFCFYELAGIQKRNKQNYKWSVVEEYLKNASALYHENGLLIDEIMTKLALVDEASDVINCDEHLQFTRKDEMFRTLDEVEAMLPKLEQHPVINEIALRISFYSVALNDYLRCKNYYELYRKSSDQVSIDHYAPWVHKYHMDVIFCVRILYIVDSINKIIDHIDDFDLSPLAREWFAGFGKIGGDVIHLVIGLLIGFDNAVSLKECLLLDEANRIVDNYEWMNFPEFGLEIDVQNTDVIFFHPGQHPLENEKIKKCIFETVIELDKFSVEQQSALQEVCKIITENMVSESPTIDELKAAFNSVMLPKTII